MRNLKWVVYAKPPFAGPQQVVNYVGRYTHRVAISNHRIVDIEGGEVKFTWRDYRHNNQQKTMTLSADGLPDLVSRSCITMVQPAQSQDVRLHLEVCCFWNVVPAAGIEPTA